MIKTNVVLFNSITTVSRIHKTTRTWGVHRIATEIRKKGFTCRVINFINSFSFEEINLILDTVISDDTKIVGFSSNFWAWYDNEDLDNTFEKLNYIIDYVRNKFPNIKIIAGGTSSTFYVSTKLKKVNAIFQGFAENSLIKYLKAIEDNKSLPLPSSYSSENENSHGNIPMYSDLSTDVFDFNESQTIFLPEDIVDFYDFPTIEIGRGCIFKCKFCSFENLGKRPGTLIRDMSLVKDELVENYERWGVTRYQLLDDTFNDDMIKVEQWTRMSQSLPFKLEYTAHLRGDLVQRHKDSAAMLVESGLRGCHLGVETLDKKASRAIAKPWSGTHAREWIPEIQQTIWRDVNITVNLVLGLPYESLMSMHDGFQWAYKNKLGTVFYSYHVFPPESKLDTVSYIELNYEKYGIRFTDTGWATDITNNHETERLRDYFNLKIARATAADSWDTNVFIGLGYTREEVMSQPKKTLLDSPLYKQRLAAFIQKYVQSFN